MTPSVRTIGGDWPMPVQPPAAPSTAFQAPAPAPKAARTGSSAPGREPPAARSAQDSRPATPGGVDVAAIRRMWVDILETVKQKSKVAWIVLMEGVEVASLDGDVLTLAFANEGKRRGFTSGGKDAVLREALREMLGVEWRIDAILDNGSGQGSRRSAPPPDPGGWGAPAAPASRPFPGTRVPEPPAPPAVPPPGQVPPPAGPIDEADEVDPEGDEVDPEGDEVDPEGDADIDHEPALTGMALIEQVLGGTVIREIDNT